MAVLFAASLSLFPLLGVSFFPRTDAGQFVINLKAPTGTRIGVTEGEVARVESLIREIVAPEDLNLIVSNKDKFRNATVSAASSRDDD